jgi:hypothetical protein
LKQTNKELNYVEAPYIDDSVAQSRIEYKKISTKMQQEGPSCCGRACCVVLLGFGLAAGFAREIVSDFAAGNGEWSATVNGRPVSIKFASLPPTEAGRNLPPLQEDLRSICIPSHALLACLPPRWHR